MAYERTTTASRRKAKQEKGFKYVYEMKFLRVGTGKKTRIKGVSYKRPNEEVN